MNSFNASGSHSNSDAVRDAEATLRLIANLPAPQGLEDRVNAGLRSAPRSRRVIEFPRFLSPHESWFRAAAAAAIAFLVVGGGWGVYSRVQPGGVAATVQQSGRQSGFSNAGAVRVPQTLQAPVASEPPLVQPAQPKPAQDPSKAGLHTKRGVANLAGGKESQTPAKQPKVTHTLAPTR